MNEKKEVMIQFMLIATLSSFTTLLGVMIGAMICQM